MRKIHEISFIKTLPVCYFSQYRTCLYAADNYLKPSDDVLKQKLTPLQYEVMEQQGTDPLLIMLTGIMKNPVSMWTE